MVCQLPGYWYQRDQCGISREVTRHRSLAIAPANLLAFA